MRQPAIAIFVFASAASAQFLRLPMRFERNIGQAAPEALFQASGPRQRLTLGRGGLSLAVASSGDAPRVAAVRLTWLGSAGATSADPSEKLPGVSNYYIGDQSSEWHTGIPHYARVTLREVYPGADLVCYGKDHRDMGRQSRRGQSARATGGHRRAVQQSPRFGGLSQPIANQFPGAGRSKWRGPGAGNCSYSQ